MHGRGVRFREKGCVGGLLGSKGGPRVGWGGGVGSSVQDLGRTMVGDVSPALHVIRNMP